MRRGSEIPAQDWPQAPPEGAVGRSGFAGCPMARLHGLRWQPLKAAIQAATTLRPGLSRADVSIIPSWILKIPGNLSSQAWFAAGTYWRALASMAATPGTCAASPAEWISDAPGHVRSCTHRNILFFCAAAAISNTWL